ncbi:protein E6 [Neltuma alba]|uniref:protein E6 n=1 Tax=Neltuma alba TaxID=207710 RepID=UPI0010A3504E|nr:protein E6-like [Prosopis alba]
MHTLQTLQAKPTFLSFTVMASMAASFSNCISLLLLITLFMSPQIHARDSQFFSKVTHVTIPTHNNNNVVKETEPPKKEEPVNKPEQEPSFMPETESSYGLYGHESGQFAPTTTTTTTYKPYKTEPEQHTDKYPNKYYFNNDAYNTNQNEFTNTKLTGTGYSNNNNYYNYKTDAYGRNQNEFNSVANQNNHQKYYYNNDNSAVNDRYFDNNNNAVNDRYFYNKHATKNSYHSNNNVANNRYNGEKQGMSDTRFMEGGKYFYDINSEKYDQTLYGDSSRGVNSRGWENNKGYFGNNNAKSYENNNSFEGYQNQEEFEEEPEDFEP